MTYARQSRRGFVVSGATVLCTLGISTHLQAQPREAVQFIRCAVIQMRPSHNSTLDSTSTHIARRMCQLTDESVQWNADVALIAFPHVENLTLLIDSPEVRLLQSKAESLNVCLSFNCMLAEADAPPKPASVFIDPREGKIASRESVIDSLYFQRPSKNHDAIRYVHTPITTSEVFNFITDSSGSLVG